MPCCFVQRTFLPVYWSSKYLELNIVSPDAIFSLSLETRLDCLVRRHSIMTSAVRSAVSSGDSRGLGKKGNCLENKSSSMARQRPRQRKWNEKSSSSSSSSSSLSKSSSTLPSSTQHTTNDHSERMISELTAYYTHVKELQEKSVRLSRKEVYPFQVQLSLVLLKTQLMWQYRKPNGLELFNIGHWQSETLRSYFRSTDCLTFSSTLTFCSFFLPEMFNLNT